MTWPIERAWRRRMVAVVIVAVAFAGWWLSSRGARQDAAPHAGSTSVRQRPRVREIADPQPERVEEARPRDDRETARALGVLNATSSDVDAVRDAIERGWAPPAGEPEPARRSVPRVPSLRRADAKAIERSFRRMPPDGEWQRQSKRTVDAQRARLGRIGLQLKTAECRRDACRFELVMTGARAERRRQRFGGQPRTLATDQSAVHTTFEPSGTVRSIVYLSRNGPLSLG